MGKILFGLILVVFDINLEGFDLLPNFIGFIIILFGLKSLSVKYPAFKKCKPIAIILLLLSILTIFMAYIDGTPIYLVSTFFMIIFYFLLAKAIKSIKNIDKKIVANLFRALVFLTILNIISYGMSIYMGVLVLIEPISMAALLIVNIYILYIINKVRKKIKK